MSIPTIAVIPLYNQWAMTAALVDDLLADEALDRLVLVDNGSDDPETLDWLDKIAGDSRIEVLHRDPVVVTGRSLYASWNEPWRDALERHAGAFNIAFLNNDLAVPAGFVGHLAAALREAGPDVWIVYPDERLPVAGAGAPTGAVTPTRGLSVHGEGMSGYAFMLKGEAHRDGLPLFDEGFLWLCGDTDLILNVEALEKTAARVEGLPVDHQISATAKTMAWYATIRRIDKRRRRAKWG